MINKWISCKKRLPKMNVPVLCIIKALCECAHYGQMVAIRFDLQCDDGAWEWHNAIASLDDQILRIDNSMIIYWQPLLKMPKGFIPAWEE